MRYRVTIGLLVLTALLTGCWDRIEVNDLAIVDLAAVDKAEAGVRLTVSVIIPANAQTGPSAGGKGSAMGAGANAPAVAYSAEGESVMNAMAQIQERLPRRLFWAHTRLLIIGEELARSGVRPALDFWSRHREPRPLMLVAVTEGQASDIVQARPGLERLLSEALREIINQRLQARVTIKDFLGWLRSETDEPIAPRIQLVAEDQGQGVKVSGTGVFRDDRLVGWLSDGETRGLLWLRGEINTGIATVDVPSGGKVSMMLIRGRTNVRPDFRSGRLRMRAEIVADDDVYESSAPIDFGKDEIIQVIEEFLRKDVDLRVRQVLDKLQHEFKVDAVRFGEAVRRNAPLEWERGLKQQWPDVFQRVPVDIVVTAHVRRTGEHGAPISTEDRDIQENPKQLRKPRE